MDQVKKILTRYVEWIALALGFGFLLWMCYSYVYQPPVTVAVGSKQVTPGQIDPEIWEQAGKKLKAQIDADTAVTVDVPPFGADVKGQFDAPTPDAVALINGTFVTDVKPPADNGPTTGPSTPFGAGDRIQVTALPEVPPMVGLQTSTGHSNVKVTADATNAVDRPWVSVAGTIPTASGIAPAFKACNVPANANVGSITVLRVTAVREELQASGTWGPEFVVPSLGINALQDLPPAKVANVKQTGPQSAYLKYAQDNAPLILRPPFYTWVEGDVWYVPGTKNPNERALELVADKFDPAHPPTDRPLTEAEQEAVRKYKQEQAAQRPRPNTPTTPRTPPTPTTPRTNTNRRGTTGGRNGGGGTGGGGGGGGGAPSFLVQDPDRPQTPTDEMGQPPLQMPPRAAPDGGAAQPPAAALAELPKPPFLPSMQPDFQAWVHDDTVQPGKTYRYKLRYVISSPVFGTDGLCKPASLALTFALTSKDSDWTDAVKVESDTNFFAAGLARGDVKFDIFKWKSGAWQVQTVVAGAGDAIGTGDFASGWTVVDVRDVAGDTTNKVVLLASDNGTLQREVKIDIHNKQHVHLTDLVANPKGQPGGMPPATPDAGTPGNGGRPPANPPRDGPPNDDAGRS